ncbi:CvpA family protein [Hydrogenimonas sp.]
MHVNWFDSAIVAIVFLIGIKGLFNGVIREMSGFIGIVAGIWLGSLFADEFGRWLGAHLFDIDSVSALNMIGFLILLAATWLGFIVIGVLAVKFLALTTLGTINRLFGFVFASAKVFIILSVIVYALSTIEIVRKNAEPYARKSLFYPWFIKVGEAIVHIDAKNLVKKGEAIKKEAEIFIEKSIHSPKKEKNVTSGNAR